VRQLLNLAFFAALATSSVAQTLAHWRFEENGDSQANSASFALEMSPTTQYSESVPGATILSEGQSLPNKHSYAGGASELGSILPVSEVLENALSLGSFTIEGFLKLNDGAAKEEHMRIIGNASHLGNPGGWSVAVSKGNLVFSALQTLAMTETSSAAVLASEPAMTENQWHHFAVVGYRGPESLVVRLFIDGQEVEVEQRSNFYAKEQNGPAIWPNSDPVLISSKNIFRGEIDELRISEVALDPTEFLTASP